MKARNPSTGTLETVYVKALDSMPVGTQIEYTGDTIPTGWEEVNDYSTTEVNTGKKWIDGKPIYRKVISVNNTAVGNNNPVNHNINNFGDLISVKGVFFDEYNNQRQYPLSLTDGKIMTMGVSTTQIIFNGNIGTFSAMANRTHTFILEYTKSS